MKRMKRMKKREKRRRRRRKSRRRTREGSLQPLEYSFCFTFSSFPPLSLCILFLQIVQSDHSLNIAYVLPPLLLSVVLLLLCVVLLLIFSPSPSPSPPLFVLVFLFKVCECSRRFFVDYSNGTRTQPTCCSGLSVSLLLSLLLVLSLSFSFFLSFSRSLVGSFVCLFVCVLFVGRTNPLFPFVYFCCSSFLFLSFFIYLFIFLIPF
jgi:hypothetical protein